MFTADNKFVANTNTHYQAYASGKANHVAETPYDAAKGFFEKNPTARKCNITSGMLDGIYFVTVYGRASEGQWPSSYKDVTKKMLDTLPKNS